MSRNLDVIFKIDVGTLEVIDTIDVGGSLGKGLAMVGNRIFYATQSPPGVGVYDLLTGDNDRSYIISLSDVSGVRTFPGWPNTVFVARPGSITGYEVSGSYGSEVLRNSSINQSFEDFGVSSSGERLWVPHGVPYGAREIPLTGAPPLVGMFETGAHTSSITSPTISDRELLAVGGSGVTGVHLYDSADPTPLAGYDVGRVFRLGLAFAPDGSRLYAAATQGGEAALATIYLPTGSVTKSLLLERDLLDPGFGQLVVEQSTGRVFVSGLDSVAVYEPDGTLLDTIEGVPGAGGMATSAPAPATPPTTSTTTTTTSTTLPNHPPTISSFSAVKPSGAWPLSTAFQWTIGDPDPDSLTCWLDFDADGVNDTTVRSCTSSSLGSGSFTEPGTHVVRLTVDDGRATTTAVTTVEVGSIPSDLFDITLRPTGTITPTQLAAFDTAATRWESIIKAGLADTQVTIPTNSCGTGSPAFSGVIDDLMIDIVIGPIDGPSGILGQAGPCITRAAGGLPAYGSMRFDSADIASLENTGQLPIVIRHEMAHVLGFGTIWSAPLLSGAGTTNPVFNGPTARGAWHSLGGSGPVPVENTGGAGSVESHWRESILVHELMTKSLNYGPNPLSAITIGSLADLGYGVDLAAADAYELLAGLRLSDGPAPLGTVQLIRPSRSVP